MLNKLTLEQEAKLTSQRDKWLKIGLSTDPLDFEKTKQAAIDAYAVAGLAAPEYFYHFKSPLSAALAATFLKNGAQVWDQIRDQVGAQVGAQIRAQVGAQVWDQVWDQVRDQVGDQVRAQVRDQVWDQVGDQVGAQVWDQVWAQVWDQVWDQVRAQVWDQVRAQVWDQIRAQVGAQIRDQVRAQVWDQVRDQVGAQIRDQVGAQVRAMIYGSHDADWLAFYETILKFGIDCCVKLKPLIEISKNCGWWAPYQNHCIFQDRPSLILFDDQRRLHCEDGPSIKYPDDFSIYSWHGTRIPGEWIKDKNSLTAESALKWENLEQRRAACEIIGWDLILDQLNAKTIDKDKSPEIGELVKVVIPEIGEEQFLRVQCGTGRGFALPVPPYVKTAHEANSWTYGLKTNEYNPEVRT